MRNPGNRGRVANARMTRFLWSTFLAAAVLAGCGSSSDDTTDGADPDGPIDGELMFLEPQPGANTLACGHCHGVDNPEPDGVRRPGHSIRDAAVRTSFKNGQLDSLLDAVNVCRTEWMAAPAFDGTEPVWLALLEYLESLAPEGPGQAVPFDVVAPPADPTGGDPEAGRDLFNSSCIVCHGLDGIGTERAPIITGIGLSPEYIARRIRTSGLEDSIVYDDLTGGRMPFWAADRLSDKELLDIVAYVNTSEDPRPDGGGDGDGDGNGDGETRECEVTHPSVGQVAVLSERFHDVGGTATIVDDCTIRIDNFTFDGLGIDVRIYGGLDNNYLAGFGMGPDLRRDTPYDGESIEVQLPDSMSLDDLDGISVWCVPAAVSFGDGQFAAP